MKWLAANRMSLVFVGCMTAIVLGSIGPAHGATITVGPPKGSARRGYEPSGYDFDGIQAGIDAALDADTVLAAPGEYLITEPITFRGKAITVKSKAGPDETFIRMVTPSDASRASVVIFENGETCASVLDGFTITGGRGSLISSANPQVGGGIVFDASAGTVRNCIVVENEAKHMAGVGAAGASGATSPTLTNCIIRRNSATNYGGGVCYLGGSSMTVSACTIVENSAGKGGGGVFCNGASMTLTHCAIARNTAGDYGGGLYNQKSPMTLINCTIRGNSAGDAVGGLLCYDGASATVTNSIFWENRAPDPEGDQITADQGAASVVTVAYSNVAGGQAGVYVGSGGTLDWGEGNIDADPCFADPDNHDFHLKSAAGRWDPASQTWVQDDVTSPCIDAGDLLSPIGWEPFPNGGFVNMGVYGATPDASQTYFGTPPCETIVAGDINGDGLVNRTDLEIMALHWTDDVPLPLP